MRYSIGNSLLPVLYLAILVINSGAVPVIELIEDDDTNNLEKNENDLSVLNIYDNKPNTGNVATQTDQSSCNELDAYKRITELLAAQPRESNMALILIENIEIKYGELVDENSGYVDWDINQAGRKGINPAGRKKRSNNEGDIVNNEIEENAVLEREKDRILDTILEEVNKGDVNNGISALLNGFKRKSVVQ